MLGKKLFTKNNSILIICFVFLFSALAFWFIVKYTHTSQSQTFSTNLTSGVNSETLIHESTLVRNENPAISIPKHVKRTLALIDAGLWPDVAASPGTSGGRIWHNREKILPIFDTSHRKIIYREWDINSKQKYRHRDAQRIVTGSDGSAWYTLDHYCTFHRIR